MKTQIVILIFSAAACAETPKPAKPSVTPGMDQPCPTQCKVADPGASEAVKLAHEWQSGDPMPVAGDGGAVIFRYGAAMPPIVCAPERLTIILLEAGERIDQEPILGDTLRWQYKMRLAGEGTDGRAAIILKPTRPDISTDLVIFTNRREYPLRLIAKATEHLTQVEFSYPQDAAGFAAYKASVANADARADAKKPAATTIQNCAYSITASKGKRPPFTPLSVCDDGKQTTLKMPMNAIEWETAVLQTAGPNGCESVNYSVDEDRWIVHRLFNRAELVSGTGRHAQRVEITRDGAADTGAGCSKKPAHAEVIEPAKGQ